MADSLVDAFWKAMVWGSRWFGGKGFAAFSRATSMQRFIPAIETTEGHHSSLMCKFLKTKKICVSVEENSREKDWPGWGRRLVMAWIAAGLLE